MEINLLADAKKLALRGKNAVGGRPVDAIAAEAAMHRLPDTQKRVQEQRLLENQKKPNADEPRDVVRAEIERSL